MDRVEELRQRAEKEREQGCGRGGKGYSEAFRKDAAKCVLAELKKGVRCSRIAKGLGVGWVTLEQWLPKNESAKSQGAIPTSIGDEVTIGRVTRKRRRRSDNDIANRRKEF